MKNDKTLLQRYGDKIKQLKQDISGDDITAACTKFNKSRPTISRALNGDIRNLTLAEKLLPYLKNIVNRREAKID